METQKSKNLFCLNSQLIFAPKEKDKIKKHLRKSPLKTNIFGKIQVKDVTFMVT